MSTLQPRPEIVPLIARMSCKIGARQRKRKNMHHDPGLSRVQSGGDDLVDILHHRIGQGKAADRGAFAMNENARAGQPERLVTGVGKSEIIARCQRALTMRSRPEMK